jgi:hypothetical protein
MVHGQYKPHEVWPAALTHVYPTDHVPFRIRLVADYVTNTYYYFKGIIGLPIPRGYAHDVLHMRRGLLCPPYEGGGMPSSIWGEGWWGGGAIMLASIYLGYR